MRCPQGLEEEVVWARSEELAVCSPMEELSPELTPAGTLASDFQAPEL